MVSIEKLVAYEANELTGKEIRDLFQELVSTGQAWILPKSYGDVARAMIWQEMIHMPGGNFPGNAGRAE